MHDGDFLNFDRVPIEIKREVKRFSEKVAKENGMECQIWYHDDAICIMERKEGDFRRSIQISLHKDENDKEVIVFIPGLEKYIGKKRRMMSQIPKRFITTLFFSDLNEQSFGHAFHSAITFSYFITPAMLDREDEIA